MLYNYQTAALANHPDNEPPALNCDYVAILIAFPSLSWLQSLFICPVLLNIQETLRTINQEQLDDYYCQFNNQLPGRKSSL